MLSLLSKDQGKTGVCSAPILGGACLSAIKLDALWFRSSFKHPLMLCGSLPIQTSHLIAARECGRGRGQINHDLKLNNLSIEGLTP